MTGLARDMSAVLDWDVAAIRQDGEQARARRFTGAEIVAYLQVGQQLLAAAVQTGGYRAATAAVEVFRIALSRAGDNAALHNGLGAALVERARLENSTDATASMAEAAAAFRTAGKIAARQRSPRAAVLRYRINLAMVLWMQGEREKDAAQGAQAVALLREIAAELTDASPYWSHLQDNLGNALMALGKTDEAIAAYQAALAGRQIAADRGRSLNNLGTAFADQNRHAEAVRAYRAALALQQRDKVPLAWARTQHNLATSLLREAMASNQPLLVGKRLNQAIKAFDAARAGQDRLRSRADWAATTANLASAHVSLGVHLHELAMGSRSARQIQHAIALYREAAPALDPGALRHTVENCAAAVAILRRVSDGAAIAKETRDHLAALASLAAVHGVAQPLAAFASGRVEPTPTRTADARRKVLPNGLHWPTETYSQAHRERGENVVAFLSRVWSPLIKAGLVDMRVLRANDPSAAKGVDNFTRKIDPATGQRQRLPAHLHLPTKRELNDRLAASIAEPGDRPARLDWALRSRARRANRN